MVTIVLLGKGAVVALAPLKCSEVGQYSAKWGPSTVLAIALQSSVLFYGIQIYTTETLFSRYTPYVREVNPHLAALHHRVGMFRLTDWMISRRSGNPHACRFKQMSAWSRRTLFIGSMEKLMMPPELKLWPLGREYVPSKFSVILLPPQASE